jgi:hypothetical protein
MTGSMFRSFLVALVLGTLPACGGADGDASEVTSFDESSDGEAVASTEQELEFTAQERCPDLVVYLAKPKLCGPQDGPFDISPVRVQCTRTCVTDRFMQFTPAWPGGVECGSGATECTPWECEPCEPGELPSAD